ncbi:solute carrier family 46 member 3-like [Oppia nitens]|uniref:solute carrier family 46 member 3-like n=1 Tax=Oppia nitens TaxID=1686743 RepID=UPI0023DABA72|nr:solute carrier family 46 member 3-like [Oppia nitens]
MSLIKKISVEPIALLYMFAIFGEFTCLQDMIFIKSCLSYLGSNNCTINKSIESQDLIQIEAISSQQLLYYNTLLAMTSILSSFIAGSYGDSYGRVIPLLLPPMLSFVVQIILIINTYFNTLVLIMICGVLSGLSGGSPSLLANCFGFISDITHTNNRTIRLIILEANLFCGAFVVSERHASHINERQLNDKNIFKMFVDVIKTVFRRRQSNNRKIIILLIITFIAVSYATEVLQSLLFLYVHNRPLVWDTTLYAYYSGLKFGVTGLALCLLPLVQYYCCNNISDTTVAIIGIFSRTLGLILIGLSTNIYVMFSTIILLVFSEYPLPAIRSLLSKLIESDEKGKVFAFLTLFHNICTLSGAILFPIIFKYQIQNNAYSGLCFQVIAFIQVLAIIIFIYIRYELKTAVIQSNEESNESDETNDINTLNNSDNET